MKLRIQSGLIAVALLLSACDMNSDVAPAAEEATKSGIVSGTVTYRERIALPPDALVDVQLLDVSLMDVAAEVIAQVSIKPSHQVPIPFEITYDTARIDDRRDYAIRATIIRGENMLFVTDTRYPVITRGNPASADLILVRSGGGASPVADASLGNTRWQLKTLNGKTISLAPEQRAPFLRFADGSVSGLAGCNNFTGAYTSEGSALEFGKLASTMMACEYMDLESEFHSTLGNVERFEVNSTWLTLSGADGELATLEAWYE